MVQVEEYFTRLGLTHRVRVCPEMLVAIPYVAIIARHHYYILGWPQLSGQFLRGSDHAARRRTVFPVGRSGNVVQINFGSSQGNLAIEGRGH